MTATASNVGASLEASEPEPDGFEGIVQKSVWFQWTAPTTAVVQIDTFGSTFTSPIPFPFKAVPAVWTGTTVSALTEIRGGGTPQSKYVSVVSGTTYRIAVYGNASDFLDEGNIVLHITNDTSSRISGTITHVGDLSPIGGIIAQAHDWNGFYWEPVSWGFTDAAGEYTIRGLTSDTYRVGFSDWDNRDGPVQWIGEYYNNVADVDSATSIVVPPAGTVTGINATLVRPSAINGIVTGPDGITPLPGIWVDVYQWAWPAFDDWYWVGSDSTAADGFFEVGGLAAGTYRFCVIDPGGDYIGECYDDVSEFNFDGATDIVLDEETTFSGIAVALSIGSKISGTIVAEGGLAPLANVEALAYRWDGATWLVQGGTSTDEDGGYTIGGLTSGTYRVKFQDYIGEYVPEFYDDAPTLDSGTSIIVTEGADVLGVDAALAPVLPVIVGLQSTNSGTADIFFTGVWGRDYILQSGILASNQWEDIGVPVNCAFDTNSITIVTEAPAPFADDFGDNMRNMTSWPYYAAYYGGVLSETNARLEFTTTNAPPLSHVNEAYLRSGTIAQYTNSFSLFVDIENHSPGNIHRSSFLFVEFTAANHPGNQLAIQFSDFSTTNAPYFATTLKKEWSNIAGTGGYIATTDVLRVRIDFNATSKVVSAFYTPSSTGDWTFAASYGVAGSNGVTSNTQWGLDNAGQFFVGLRAMCSFDNPTNYTGIGAGMMFFDNVAVQEAHRARSTHEAFRLRRYP